MAEKLRRWTVDVEKDYGGRIHELRGIAQGLPRIVSAFKQNGIKGLFFISTEVLEDYPWIIDDLRRDGQEIGSHGHFHTIYKETFRKEADKALAEKYLGCNAKYRAPKFNYVTKDPYSNPKNHVSLLKHMWLGQKIKEETIIYLHPFDITHTPTLAPDLFCRFWYSKPWKAFNIFEDLVSRYK